MGPDGSHNVLCDALQIARLLVVGRDSLQQSIDKVGHAGVHVYAVYVHRCRVSLQRLMVTRNVLLQYMKKRNSIIERDGVQAP